MTEKLYYSEPYLREVEATIAKIDFLNGKEAELILDKTIFYPEGGGQPSDRGVIESDNYKIEIDHVYKKDGEVIHHGFLKGNKPKAGDIVKVSIDWFWRYENMKQHTGQHILSAIILKKIGAETTGFQIFDKYNKIEIETDEKLNWNLITEIEIEANHVVSKSIDVEAVWYNELPEDLEQKLRKYVSEKVKGKIRIVKIDDIDIVPCGGMHVKNTREVGLIKVLRFYQKTSKVWRIEFVCGNRALIELNKILLDYSQSLKTIGNKNYPLFKSIEELKESHSNLWKEKEELRKQLIDLKIEGLIEKSIKVKGFNVIILTDEISMKEYQEIATRLIDTHKKTIFLGATNRYALFAKSKDVAIDMNELMRAVMGKFDGKGGGSAILAKGGKYNAKPDEIINEAIEKIKEFL
ncbi:MAG: alanyl-tRNA editing protein AlaX [Candidatus Aenigmarchaeota archaeon]|nr:alanyl-tRNA editing protein AlaX [Candidatus Aenigmarchaeota archaeon]